MGHYHDHIKRELGNAFPVQATIAACEAIEEWELSDEQIKQVLADLPKMLEAREEARNELAYERHQAALMESGGPDDSAYRRQMIDAGRGHLLK